MNIPETVLSDTTVRWQQRAVERAHNQSLIAQKRYLEIDQPRIISTWLRKRGLSGKANTGADAAVGVSETSERLAEVGLERVIGNNDLVGISFLESGLRAARAVARISVLDSQRRLRGFGTGFLVSPRLLLTNHHVFGFADDTRFSRAEFDYALALDQSPREAVTFEFSPDEFFYSHKPLDFALVAVRPKSAAGVPLSSRGWNPLLEQEGKAIIGQYVNIIQHPNGERQQVVLRDNRIVDRLPEFLHYVADTNPGSSGSAVFNDLWQVVALHHSGVPARDGAGHILALDGRIWRSEMGEDNIQWTGNEGVRISTIMKHLKGRTFSAAQMRLIDELSSPMPTESALTASTTPAIANSAAAPGAVVVAADGTATWTIPLSVSVSLGLPVVPTPQQVQPHAVLPAPSPDVRPAVPASEREVLEAAQAVWIGRPEVVNVRLGWRFQDGWITKERALVVSVREKLPREELVARGIAPLPHTYRGMPVDVTHPSLEELLIQKNGLELRELANAAGSEITYVPVTDMPLSKVSDKMKVIAHASPDAGWPVLRDFIGGARRTLTAGIYEFKATHIRDEFLAVAAKPQFRNLTLCVHGAFGRPNRDGVRKEEMDIVDKLEQDLATKFQCAWIQTGSARGWVATSYHIKVIVRDSSSFWLSSGNWKDSGQPNHEPLKDNPPQKRWLDEFNREWHVVVEHPGLAKTFEHYLKHDFDNNPVAPDLGEAALPDLLVPEKAFLGERAPAWKPKYFAPLVVDRVITVQPLLTPDNYLEHVLDMVRGARSELWIENQSFDAPNENQEALAELMNAIIDKQRRGVDVRIIFRKGYGKERKNLEDLQTFGFDTSKIKVQDGCHTKGIVVDGERVLLGSQNITGTGITENRDASLIFEDEQIAAYYRDLFLYDWDQLADQKVVEEIAAVRLIDSAEPTPPGFRRLSPSEYLPLM